MSESEKRPSRFVPSLLLLAAIVLLGFAVWELVVPPRAAQSLVQHGFVDPDALTQIDPYIENRFRYQFVNQGAKPARIVGNNLC